MNRTVLVIGIIFFLIGASVVSSTDNFDENISDNSHILESVYSSENRFDTTWYYFWAYGPLGTGFYAYYPNGTYNFCECEGVSFSGGTWTNDGRYLCCEYVNGFLYDVDPETLEASLIGGGGVGLNGLAYDPVGDKLYGASSNSLYEIDDTTGGQSYIGSFGIGTTMIAIAFDIDGICYGWDVLFSGESHLYTIDTDTGEATVVGGMGYNLLYNQDGAFELDTDILYLVAYTSGQGCLLECDEDTGECILLGYFEGSTNPTALAISYGDKMPPVTNISFVPPEPNGCNGWYISNVTVILNASDESGVYSTFYRINGGDWEYYESPFIISEEGEDILIEYYSLDNMGNFEDKKSATLDIDKTPPEMNVEWDVEKVDEGEWEVTFYIEITDAISGSEGLEIYLNDALLEILSGPGPFSWSCVITEHDISFKFITSDLAGNQAFVIVNSSEINTFANIKSYTYQTKSVWFLQFFERFPLFKHVLNILEWYN